MSPNLQLAASYLDRAMAEFDVNPVAARFLRRLAKEVPDAFFSLAVDRLSSDAKSNAHRFLAMLVLRQDSLLKRLANPAFSTRDNAVILFRRFLEVDPLSDVRLAQLLPSRNSHSPDLLNGSQAERALDILDATSSGRRLLPFVLHLPENGDPRISAKATLFVGHRIKSPEWTARQLCRPDQRVRANAVEALWGVKGPEAIRIFEDHRDDSNNRVVGNSLMGLHIAQRHDVDTTILANSQHPNFAMRATTAWAMGKIGNSVFYDRLAQLVRDEHAEVRSIAVRAIADLRRTEAKEEKPVAAEAMPANASPAPIPQVAAGPEPAKPIVDLRLDGSSFRARRK
ncbi:MAG TPA: HEAT repeat domain-containing protein [Bryobacteraceae bacterium]|nr:HEAT repeat domain-containing protein [Bryobacteraceae bacterium]